MKYITDLEWMVRNFSTASLSLSEMTDIHRRGWDEENALGRVGVICENALRRINGMQWRRISTVVMVSVSEGLRGQRF